MQLVAEYKIEFHGDEAVGVVGVVAAGSGAAGQRGSVETIMGLLTSGCRPAGQCTLGNMAGSSCLMRRASP